MQVHIPTPLRTYTHASVVHAEGGTLAELLKDLDRQYPGMRFRIVNEQDRIREHIRFFVNQEIANSLAAPLQTGDDVHIIMAISGG